MLMTVNIYSYVRELDWNCVWIENVLSLAGVYDAHYITQLPLGIIELFLQELGL